METAEAKKYHFVTWNGKAVCFSTEKLALDFKAKLESNPFCTFIGIEIVSSNHSPFMTVHESLKDFENLMLGEFPSELKEGFDILELKDEKLYFFCYNFRKREAICFDSLENAVKEQIHLTNHLVYDKDAPIYVILGDYFTYGSKVCHEEIKDDNAREQFQCPKQAVDLLRYNWNDKHYPFIGSLVENAEFRNESINGIEYNKYKLAYFVKDFPMDVIEKYVNMEYDSYKKHAVEHADAFDNLASFQVLIELQQEKVLSRDTEKDAEFKEKVGSKVDKLVNDAKKKELLQRIHEYSWYARGANSFLGMFMRYPHCGGRLVRMRDDYNPVDDDMVDYNPADDDTVAQLIADEISTLPNSMVKKIVARLNS